MPSRSRSRFLRQATLFAPAVGLAWLALPEGLKAQSEQATKYHELLRKRPQPGLVMDRFINAWLETDSSESLAAYLQQRTGTANDLLVLALFHEYEGREAEALKAYQDALTQNPSNAAAWLQRGRLEARMLNFDAALQSLTQATVQKPTPELALDIGKLQGRLLLRTGHTKEALQVWQDLLAAHPDDEDLVEELIDVQVGEGLLDEAAALCRQLISKTKDTSVAVTRRLLLADILTRASKREEALKVYAEALEKSGQGSWVEGEILAQIEGTFRKGGDLSGLTTHLSTLQKTHPQRSRLLQQQARILAETGAGEKALMIYQDLLQRTPGQRDLREAYLDLLTRLEKYSEAIEQTKLLQEQNPTDGELHIRLAGLHQKNKDLKAAQESLTHYLALPNSGEYEHLRAARLLETWELKAEAKAAYEALVKTFPQSPSAREAQAHFLHRIGERDAALTLWRELAKTDDLEQLLAIAQSLTTRLEPDAAREVLYEHREKFSQEDRYLTALIHATLNSREINAKEEADRVQLRLNRLKEAIPWALTRVRLARDESLLEDAVRQTVELLTQANAGKEILDRLRGQTELKIQERCLLAALQEASGDKEAAEQTLQNPSPTDTLLAQNQLVRLIEKRQDFTRAAQEAEKIIPLPEGRTSQNLQRVVDLYSRAGLPQQALKWIPDWKALSPSAAQPWLMEAQLLNTDGKPEEAVKVLRSAVRKFEDEEGLASSLATSLIYSGQTAEAERLFLTYYDKAEEPDTKKRWVTTLAQAAYARGTLSRVIETFQERQRAHRQDPMPWLALAEIHRIGQNDAERRLALAEASRLTPRDVNLLQQLARAEEDGGQWQDALRTLEKAAALDTTSRSLQQIASLHLTYGDEAAGYRMLFNIAGGAEMEPKDAIRLADGMAARGDWKRLLEFIDPILKKHPEDYRLAYVRAVALEEDDQLEEAAQAFCDLIKIKAELPSNTQTKTVTATAPWFYMSLVNEAAKELPTSYQALQKMLNVGLYQSYQHQYQRRFNMRSSNGIIYFPPNVESVPAMVAAHLICLTQSLPPSRAALVWSQADTAGLPATRQLRYMVPDMARYSISVPQENLEASGWDEGLLAHAALTSSLSSMEPLASQKAFEAFGKNYPVISLALVISTLPTDPLLGRSWLDQALDAFERKGKVSTSTLFSFSQLLGGGQRVNSYGMNYDLTDDQTSRMLKLLTRLLTETQDNNGRTTPFAWVANSARAAERWPELIQILEAEVELFQDPAKRTGMIAKLGLPQIRNAQIKLLKAIPFPPAITLPPHVAFWFQRKDFYNPDPSDGVLIESDFEPLKPLLSTVKNPVLRFVLTCKSGDTEGMEKELKARLENPSASVEDWLLSAGVAQQKEDHRQAAEWLMKIQSQPLDQDLRAQVDAALVYSATLLDKPAPPLLQAASQALRRLRSKRVTTSERDELIVAMTTLGMTEEANQWKRVAAMVPASSSSNYVSYSSSSSTSKLQNLIAKGNREAILREASNVLKNLYSSNFRQNNSSYAKSETKRVLTYLTGIKEARAELMKNLNPGEGSSVLKRREYAGLLEMLDQVPEATALYQKLLDENPNDHDTRVRLIIVTAPKEPQKAAELLKQISLKSLGSGLGNELIQVLSNSWDMEFESRLGLIEAIASRLEEPASEPIQQSSKALEWAVDLPVALTRSLQYGRNPLYLHQRYQNQASSSSASQDGPKMRRLIEVHQRLCLAMMAYPSLADEGFRWYACTRLAETGDSKAVQEDLHRRAIEILKSAAALSRVQRMPKSSNGYMQMAAALPNPTPAEYLIWQAWQKGETERLQREILPLITSARTREDSAPWLLQAKLWTCPEEDFTSTALSYLKTGVKLDTSFKQHQQKLVWLSDCWAARDIRNPVLDEVIYTFHKSNTSGDYDGYDYLSVFLQTRRKQVAGASEDEFLHQWLISALGAETSWKKRMDTWVTTRYGNGGAFNDRQAYCTGQTIEDMTRKEGLLSIGMKLAAMIGLSENETWMGNQIYSMSSVAANGADETLTFLDAIHALSEAPTYLSFKATHRREHPLTELVKNLRDKPSLLAEVKKKIQARTPQTFGSDILLAMLQENVPATLTEALKKRREDLKKIPPERANTFNALLKTAIPALNNPATADAALVQALAPLLEKETNAQKDEIERITKASSLAEVNISDNIFENQVPRLMAGLVNSDRELARQLFLNAAQLIEAKARSNGWNGDSWSEGWTYRSELVDDFDDQASGLTALAFTLQLCQEDDSGMLILDGKSQEGHWSNTLMDAWKKAGGQARPAAAVNELLTSLHRELGQTSPTLLALGFYEFYVKLPPGMRVPVLKAALKEDSTDTQSLRRELACAGRFYLGTESNALGNEELQKTLSSLGGLAPAWEHYRQQMNDEQINPRVRIALAAHLATKDIRRPDPDIVRKSMDLIAKEQRAFHAVSGDFHFTPLARAFCQLPLNEAWKTAAQEQWEAWVVRNSRNNENSSRNRAYSPRDETPCAMLGIVARLGHDEAIRRLLAEGMTSLNDDPSAFVTLVTNGAHTAAQQWLEQQWANFLYDPYTGIEFTPALTEELPKFIASCSNNPDLAMLGEMICAVLKDPPKQLQAQGFIDHNRRILNAVPKLKATPFKDDEIRTRCLEHTATLFETFSLLHEEYLALAQKSKASEILELADTWKTFRRMKPIAAGLAHQFWTTGDDTNLLRLFQELRDSEATTDERLRAYTYNYLASPVLDYLEWHWSRNERGDLKKVLAYTDKLIEASPRHGNNPSLGTSILLKLMLHTIEGDARAFETWKKNLSSKDAEELRTLVKNRNTFFVCQGYFGKPKPKLPIEERIQILTGMMADSWVQDKYPTAGTGIPNMISLIVNTHKLITLEELPEAGLAFAKALPRRGRTAAEAADLVAPSAGESSLALYDQAMADVGNDVGLRANYLFRKTDVLERLGRKEEARRLLAQLLKEPKLGPNPKRTAENALKRLQ
ncbi:Tetratricopeptide repeat [Prosthecobacter debontii]|uniref:Tetratricopeptide repeat n=1 Tax=Prosthecobacter debontii TaxID=48467 RepID=A0A1T4WL15_9BACT|nr:tetratricopeptide repeat protein [Prosthecobacter debontii]SKA77879.1 Tetratricopeptide repeat [Prosthecobacter debontii]